MTMLRSVIGDERKTCHPDGVTSCSCPAIEYTSGRVLTMHKRDVCADLPRDDPQHYIVKRVAKLICGIPKLVAICGWCKGEFVL